jgi:hypothetical protein
MNKLDETTINEVLDLFPDRKKDIGTNNYLISIMMPFIENDIQQKKETLVICGNDMKQFWNWNKIIRKKPPLLFILPTLKGLNGTDISPKSTDRDNAFGVRFNLNNKSTGFTSIDMVKQLIGEAENKDALLQIYKFFIFPLLEKSIKQIKNSIDSDGETLSEIIFKFEYKAKKGINTYCTIQDETFKEFVNKLSGFSSEELKFDLKEKVSEQLYTINNYITKSNK